MRTEEANIQVDRLSNSLSISAIFHIWTKMADDGTIEIGLPLFGVKTFAKNQLDVDLAVQEALKCFFVASDMFGQGFKKELQTLGWALKSSSKRRETLNLVVDPKRDCILSQVLQTGNIYVVTRLQIA